MERKDEDYVWVAWDTGRSPEGFGYRWIVRVVSPVGFNRKVFGDTLTKWGAARKIRRHVKRLRSEAHALIEARPT